MIYRRAIGAVQVENDQFAPEKNAAWPCGRPAQKYQLHRTSEGQEEAGETKAGDDTAEIGNIKATGS